MEKSCGYKIRKLRQQNKKTIEQVANAIDISPSALGMYERGMRTPDTKVLLRLSKLFDVELNYFLDITIEDTKALESAIAIQQYRNKSLRKAKERANGYCELCGNKAPFNLQNGEAYLEVYEIKLDSEKLVDNIVLLCPNCHKKMEIINYIGDTNHLKKILISEEL